MFCVWFVLLFSTLCPSSFVIILVEKKETVALLCQSKKCDCKWSMAFSHCALGWKALLCVVVIDPDHTHYFGQCFRPRHFTKIPKSDLIAP